jgi:sugar O-acyltransferase (sialic acid O-acetyltransferase NeuD family)
MKNLIIFGTGDIAELAHYYFSNDSGYKIAAFTVDDQYATAAEFCGLPVIPFSKVMEDYPPAEYHMFIAMGYSGLNKARKEKYLAAKQLGYDLPSYISSKATVFSACEIGENCLILENNTIQPFTKIGNNVTLWSGNHIGHHSTIADHCFISSHVVVSGGVHIEEACFIGVNASIRDHVTIGQSTVIGAGALILSDIEASGVYIGSATERSRVPSNRLRAV